MTGTERTPRRMDHGSAERPVALAAGGLLALAAAIGVGRFIYTPILPLMVDGLRMTKATAGLLASANFAGYLVGALAAAAPIRHGTRRSWLIIGLTASAITTGAMALGSSTAMFLIVRFIGGVASALVLVFASTLVLDRLHEMRRPGLAAVHFAGVGAGIACAAMLVTAIVARGGDWRVLWLAGCGLSLLACYGVARLVPSRAERPPAITPRPAQNSRTLPWFVAAYGLFGFGYVITATFLVAIVRQLSELRALEPYVWLVTGLAAAPSVAVWTSIGDRIGVIPAFALACAVEACGVAASVLWLAPAGVLLAAVFLGGTFMGITALGLIGARQLSRGDARGTLAVMTAAFGLGQIVGPAFAGMIYDATASLVVPSLVATGALLLGALLVILVR